MINLLNDGIISPLRRLLVHNTHTYRETILGFLYYKRYVNFLFLIKSLYDVLVKLNRFKINMCYYFARSTIKLVGSSINRSIKLSTLKI